MSPITDFFNEEGLINKETYLKGNEAAFARANKIKEYCIDTALFIFHKEDIAGTLDTSKLEEFYIFCNGSNKNPCYIYDKKFVIALSPLGGPAAGGLMEELGFVGIKNFFACGSAGQINHTVDSSAFVLLEKAIRCEGTSYRYLPASLYAETDKELTDFVAQYLDKKCYKYNRGITWTTDSFYRETMAELNLRKSQGAVSVEMEAASWAAIAKFKGFKFAQLLYFSDAVKQDWQWHANKGNLKQMVISLMIDCVLEFTKK